MHYQPHRINTRYIERIDLGIMDGTCINTHTVVLRTLSFVATTYCVSNALYLGHLPELVVVGFGCGVVSAEQVFSPSLHVCLTFGSSADPQFPNHDPPLPQQVTNPLLVRPHKGHAEN